MTIVYRKTNGGPPESRSLQVRCASLGHRIDVLAGRQVGSNADPHRRLRPVFDRCGSAAAYPSRLTSRPDRDGRPAHIRSGLTLTELLVVVAIVVIVSAILTPMIQPAIRGRELREAARQVNTFIQGVRARAVKQQRPVAIWIERDTTNAGEAFQLRIAEVPPAYTGDTSLARARIAQESLVLGKAELQQSPQARFFVQIGDEIRFDFRGPRYEITGIGASGGGSTLVEFRTATLSQRIPQATPGQLGVPFEIFRKPRLTSATPLDLPTGTSIVTSLCGVGTSLADETAQWIGPGTQPIAIVFMPDGRVDRIYRNGVQDVTPANQLRPLSTIYLFIGRAGVTPAENLLDTSNLWVTINPRTGITTTAVNTTIDPTLTTGDNSVRAVIAARGLATSAQGIGGR